MIRSLKGFLPHILVVFGFLIISLAYFSPVLQGKEIYQSDIVQYTGMAKEQNDFRAETGEEPYWTDSAFGGMPTYQLGAYYPHNYIKKLDSVLRFLPRPADYLFLYFIGFYILLLVLKLDYKIAFLGALAFGFSTYLIIILGVGHNAKAHAIAYMPMVLAGILLCFRNKYIGGFLLLSFAMALEIGANHFQMTYYLLLLVIVLGLVYLIDAFRKKQLPHFFKALGVMALAVLLAIATNATNLLATQEYTQYSTRGDTGLSITSEGKQKETAGLNYDYITEYSYGITETLNLFIPRFMGGSSSEKLGEDSEMYAQLLRMGASPVQAKDFAENAPTYWGNQPFVGAPAYIGASIIFLFVFALFLIKGRLKWWIVGGTILSIILSWGKNFGFVTEFFIDYIPLYNKFRAVSSIQIIAELCIPILAVFGLHKLFNNFDGDKEKFYALNWATIITAGFALILLVLKSTLFSFSGGSDSVYIEQMGVEFVRALKEDRKSIFTADAIRSLILVLIAAGFIFAYLKKLANKNLIIVGFIFLILFDLVGVDRRYVNNEDFVAARVMNKPFQKTTADEMILEDKGHYRVFDLAESPFNTGRTSYFHNSIGGYHAAKPGRIQDLYDFYISKNNMSLLNMLNVKYIIVPTEEGPTAQQNPNAMGNAWFVENIKWVNSANEEILSLADTNLNATAIINSEFKESEIVVSKAQDSTASIKLISQEPIELVYKSKSSKEEFAVFSEMYYENGWNAYVDGNETPHYNVNYVLRGMQIPAGEHTITFKFEPQVIKTGSSIALASSILLGLLTFGGIYFSFRKKD
ncbi:YfhO family protein [Gillisia hiemivivida]|uniref:YfhO family protein n=1 Tax=Gillisia hiemivivida TaxID=291190 RepID=A0A5C6ZRA1_9FLAO|nr:YfhO family protein [Gillisia hiemivivida]TXD93176.1 YfhO family protein [Gillisia hiemivivida]